MKTPTVSATAERNARRALVIRDECLREYVFVKLAERPRTQFEEVRALLDKLEMEICAGDLDRHPERIMEGYYNMKVAVDGLGHILRTSL